jgi:luciferase family oxidoreductase group 1
MGAMALLSILDLAPIVAGGTAAQAFRNALDLAQHAERWGYHRYWLAEHHNMTGVASAATSVVIGHVAAGTSTIRVGAGGIMLPNHAPLVIAEQFGTLGTLFPGRIDLGLGRAPGSDQVTARALRRTLNQSVDDFPRDVMELLAYFEPAQPRQPVQAVPGAGVAIEPWILGSSLYGVQLAAALSLPYAFASHFAPTQLEPALAIYRQQFRPSERLAAPRVMVGVNVVAADTDEEAQFLFTSIKQAFINLGQGRPGPLPAPVEDPEGELDRLGGPMLSNMLSVAIVGSQATVQRRLADFTQRTGADEIIVTAQVHDHAARLRSFEILAAARDELAPVAA